MTDNEVGKINGIAQRRPAGGHYTQADHYTQAEVDQILALAGEWAAEHLVLALRNDGGAPSWIRK